MSEKLTTRARWWMFKRLSDLGWWICPEPHKTRLQTAIPSWDDVNRVWRCLEGREP